MGADESFEKFEEFKKEFERYKEFDLNESETRSKVIDNLLKSVLGWQEEYIKREEKLDSGFFDYYISIPGLSFVIEAKRLFNQFELPLTGSKTKIKTILKSNNTIFDQLRNYCIDKGCPYGIFTNGKQFILAKLFNNDSTDWKENECLIYRSFEDIDSRFVEFFNNFSFYALQENGTFNFISTASIIEHKTISSTLINRDGELVRNNLSSLISPIIDNIFGDLFNEGFEDDIEFIKKCFVENTETKKNRDDIHRLFEDKAPEISNINPTVNTTNLKSSIKDKIISSEISIKNLTPPKPIVIIGTKGAGKTTFINYLFNYESNPEFSKNNIIATVDLRKLFNRSDFDDVEASKEILRSIYDKYKDLELHSYKILIRIYYSVIKTNDEGIWSMIKKNNLQEYEKKVSDFLELAVNDIFEHLRLLNIYLIKERRKRIIVILDNADQFPDNVQEYAYLFAHSLANKCHCGTIISLREGYYYKWRNSPPFDAYNSHVYHITAPRYSEVLNKRIKFGLERFTVDESPLQGADDKGKRYLMNKSDIYRFLSTLNQSIFSDKQTDLIDFLSYTTHPNIREGLRVFNIFLTSGHTNIDQYILKNKFKTEKNIHYIPIHEFIKSVALVNNIYYNSEYSLINNIFLPEGDSNDHFIKFYLLLELLQIFDLQGSGNRYVECKNILSIFTALGYKPKTIIACIEKLLFFNMLDTDDHVLDVEYEGNILSKNIAITAKGHYYIKVLIQRFHYIDLVLQDTPILDKKSFDRINQKFPKSANDGKRDLKGRYDSTVLFVDYLFEMDKKQPPQILSKYGKVSEYILTGLQVDLERLSGALNVKK